MPFSGIAPPPGDGLPCFCIKSASAIVSSLLRELNPGPAPALHAGSPPPSSPGRRVAGYPVFRPLIGAAKAACRPVSCNSIRFVVSSSALHSGHFCWSVVIVWSLYVRSQSRATTIHYVRLTGLQEAIVGAGHKTWERPSRTAFEYSAP